MKFVLRGVCLRAGAVADGSRVVVWLIDSTREQLTAFADSEGPNLHPVGIDPCPLGERSIGRAGRYGRIVDTADDNDTGVDNLAIPMVVGAQVIGVLEFLGEHERLPTEVVEVLETMAVHAAIALDAAQLHERTANMAMTDALTGLPNRRCLDVDLPVECSGSARYERPLALLMVDVDHFKTYNDAFGHQAGDAALQDVAGLLAHGLRATDSVYRYGGEEFALILRETNAEQATVLAERLRAAVEHHFAAPGVPRAVTISVGIATLPDRGPTPDNLVAAADAALYLAKESGRNRVAGSTAQQQA